MVLRILTCRYIDQLSNEYDDRQQIGTGHPETNPEPIIRRQRDGLAPAHQFTRALRSAAEIRLNRLVEEEVQRERDISSSVANDETTRPFSF